MGTATDERLLSPLAVLEAHGLSLRVMNMLEEHGYFIVGDLRAADVDKIENFGDACRWELSRALKSYLSECPCDAEVGNHAREVQLHERAIELTSALRQLSQVPPSFHRKHPIDRGLLKAAARILQELAEENGLLWSEVRRLRAGE